MPACVLVAVVAGAEESILRGDPIMRMKAITGTPGRAVVVSALIFSRGHGFEGTVGVISAALIGLLPGWIYCGEAS